MRPILIITLFVTSVLWGNRNNTCEAVFSHIYESGKWGKNEQGQGISGQGSTPINTTQYVQCIESFLRQHAIHSVVDAGCGDWMFSQYISWKGINYTGIDVYKDVIDKNNQTFANDHIRFIQGNIIKMELPPADLLICKDVLQHLSNRDIKKFLKKTKKYKYCLITNDLPRKKQKCNFDISRGSHKPIVLSKPPFSIQGTSLLRYKTDHSTKEIFLIVNE